MALWQSMTYLRCVLSQPQNDNLYSLVLFKSEDQLGKVKEHRGLISDIQNSKDQTMFITASKDNSAKV